MAIVVSTRPVGRPAIVQQPLVDWMVEVAQWSNDFQNNFGRRATGESQNFTIDIKNRPTVVTLAGVQYLGFALTGRGPGKPPPITAIFEWVFVKPRYSALSDQEKMSLAWAIRTNIGKRGWSTKTRTRSEKDIVKVINDTGFEHLEKLGADLAVAMAETIFASFDRRENYRNMYEIFDR